VGEVTLLRQVLPIRSLDSAVIKKAQELDSILLTVNGDFADVVEYPPANFGGIIALQLHNHPEIVRAVIEQLCRFIHEHTDRDFYRGKLFLVEVHRVRIRT
jgi:hypothetical protein